MRIREKIRVATWDDEENIAAMMTLAFCADPFVRWLLPDLYNFVKHGESYSGWSSGPAFDNGSAFVTEDLGGAALWLMPGCHVDRGTVSDNEDDFMDPAVLGDLTELHKISDSYRPNYPHWYLSLIAVDPANRGRGYGAALMAYALKICIETATRPIWNRQTRKIPRFISAMDFNFWPRFSLGRHHVDIRCCVHPSNVGCDINQP